MKNNSVFLKHILHEINNIEKFIENKTLNDLTKDEMLQHAVSRSFEIIGEASKNLSEDFKIRHIEIPWSKATGFRNRLIHEYFGIDFEEVWKTIKEDLPVLKEQVEKISEK